LVVVEFLGQPKLRSARPGEAATYLPHLVAKAIPSDGEMTDAAWRRAPIAYC